MASRGGGTPSAKWVKLMCSFGGRFALRPRDGTLRHIGGQTRLISVPRAASFGDLLRKVEAADADAGDGSLVVVKYQLPGEDLGSLVSVLGPEDYENMMEEYDKLAAAVVPGGSAKLRVFLFRAAAGRSSCSCSGSSSGSNNLFAAAGDESGQKRCIHHATNCVSAEHTRRKNSTTGSSARSSELAFEFSSLPLPSLVPERSYSGGAHHHSAFPKPVSLSAVPVTAPAMGIPSFVRTEPPALQPQYQGAVLASSYAMTLQPQLATCVPPQQPQVSSYLQQQMPSYYAQQFTVNFAPVQMSPFLPSISVATVSPVLENMQFTRFGLGYAL